MQAAFPSHGVAAERNITNIPTLQLIKLTIISIFSSTV